MTMPITSVRQLVLSVALGATVLLTGCSGFRSLSPEAPPGTTLEGVWRLNPAQSDDPRKVLESLRARARKRAQQYAANPPPEQPAQQGSRRRGQGQGGGTATDDGSQQGPDYTYQGDVNSTGMVDIRSPFVRVMASDMLRNEVLAIHQSPGSFIIDYGSSVRRLTAGAPSVVSVPGGVADQKTGWSGKDYVVDLRSQVGPDISEEYSLSQKHGRQLIVKVHLGGSGLPTVNLNLVYDPGGDATPHSFPTME